MTDHQILVVANRTLGGAQLVEAARQRVSAGADSIWIVVPSTAPPEDPTAPKIGTDLGMVPSLSMDQPAPPDAYELAESRLERAQHQFRALGVAVGGEVGDEDPLKAIGDALSRHPCEEILISTLPRSASHWLRVDLPSRAQRKFHVKVTTVPTSGQHP